MNGDRSSAQATGSRGLFRFFRRDRLTGQIAIGLVGVLCVSALVYGVGTASARYKLSDVGAWLSASAKGLVVHANGLAGKVDGKAAVVPQMRGHHIKIVQDGTTVLLVDEDTGVVSRIDPSQLKITKSRQVGGPGMQVLSGAGAAYTVDLVKGAVQQIDPLSLAPVGQAATLTAPLGQAGIDANGALWVPVPQTGTVVPFQRGRQGTPVAAGKAGDRLALTIAAGTPVITDSTSATALIVRPEGTQRINLPAPIAQAKNGVKVPAVADGQIVPMLGAGGALYLLDTGVGRVQSVALRMPNHSFEPPNVLGSRVYLPDRTSGRLLVFNTERNAWEKPVAATRPGGTIEVIVRDHMLWVNDPFGPVALAFGPDGGVKRIKKYDDKIPGSARKPLPVQANPGNGQGNRNGSGGGQGGNNPVPGRPAKPPAKKDPAAPDPPTPAASGDNGSINVRFTAAAQPQGVYPVAQFVLLGQDGKPVAVAKPGRFPGNSQGGTFAVGGLTCDTTTHIYKVAAQYKGKDGKPAYSESGEVGATACAAPGAPPSLTATPKNHTAALSWTRVPGYEIKYRVSGPNAPSGDLSATSADVGGLANGAGKTYTYTVTASNGAGTTTSQPKSVTLDPAAHAATFNGHHNETTNTYLHTGPRTTTQRDGSFPKGFADPVEVICQQGGDEVVDEQDKRLVSSVWDKIVYEGRERWVSDIYVNTPGSDSGTFSSTLWGCV
ncbi:fibronectin type III domain-containing protein [Actinomadura darangshiensis]|uniref:Fibronectin type III domain-containing protein n=1 Tax=Actinomadura darangshiensis TaxID=705336 RepID=A0A4R5AQB6_9ACTN|nr:fibronectin type III domain-containing protein [Actinomadura darangshiensis]TDD73244.1 fibronectin type III domain-containing protein [Actinomadura darangshiensis]